MTRLLWTLISLFPLPLVALLFAQPPELFERERVQTTYQIGAELNKLDIDWGQHFAKTNRVALAQVLPHKAQSLGEIGLVLERTAAEQLVVTMPTGSTSVLQYRLADSCWVLPADQITLLPRCGS